MSRKERYIKDKIGNKTPFRVPEGYFDKFATDFMEKLPEREPVTILAHKKTTFIKMWRVVAAAACIMIAVLSSTAILTDKETAASTQHVAESSTSTTSTTDQMNHDQYIDVVADYAMMDNSDIIACLSEE